MIIPDVNVLVYAHIGTMAEHVPARAWWNDLLNRPVSLGLPWSVICGFVRVTTNRRAMNDPLTIDQAFMAVDSWLASPRVQIIEPGPRHYSILQTLLHGTAGGNLVTDAHLAAIAMEHNAEIASNDNDFARFSGLKWHNPLKG